MTAIPAASELYQRYGVLVLRRARALLNDEQAARDATHDVFVKVLSALEDALGVHVKRVPATAEHLMELWLAAHPEERL